MTIATKRTEIVPLAPVAARVRNHMDVTLTYEQAERDNAAQLRLLQTARRVDSISDIRRVALVREVIDGLAILQTYCEEDGARAAFENLNASVLAYIRFEKQDEDSEDTDRRVLTSAVSREVKVMHSAQDFARRITPACTGEQPEPVA